MTLEQRRALVASLATLRCPLTVSVESFKHPQFSLMTSCLHFLLRWYDHALPEHVIPGSTPEARCCFLREAGQIALSKAGIELDLKQLYLAHSGAVVELLKLALPLGTAAAAADEENAQYVIKSVGEEAADAEKAALLAQQLAKAAVLLLDGINEEPFHSKQRRQALQEGSDLGGVQQKIALAIVDAQTAIEACQQRLIDLEHQQRGLDARADRVQAEVARVDQRLSAVGAMRPPHMDELERLQLRLADQFQLYLQRQRNIEYLELCVSKQQGMLDESRKGLRKQQRKLQMEAWQMMDAESAAASVLAADGSEDSDDDQQHDPLGPPLPPKAARPAPGQPSVQRSQAAHVPGARASMPWISLRSPAKTGASSLRSNKLTSAETLVHSGSSSSDGNSDNDF